MGVLTVSGACPGDGVQYMDESGCDFACETVGESIVKYNIPDNWCAELDAYDDVYPIIVIQVDKIRKAPAMMDLKLRIIEHSDDEYAGCMVFTEKKTIVFKVVYMSDLVKAMELL